MNNHQVVEYCKMLSIKKVFCLFLLHHYVCGKFIRNQPSIYDITKGPQELSSTTPPGIECAPDKSFHSRNDIKVMIDHIYNETFLNKISKHNYQSKAEAIRDKHSENLNFFTNWFDSQPQRLKYVLQSLEVLRKVEVEPVVEIVAGVLSEYPKLEMLFNNKNNKTNNLLNKLNRYNMICELNCEDHQIKEHNIVRRNVHDDLYCSSLKDLHEEITQYLDQFAQKLNRIKINELSLNDAKYKEKIDQIKSKLKDKALNKFGRTMYDILSLEDEYHHFMDDITSTDLNAIVYAIKSLGLVIDTNLLQLEQAIEKYGQQCNSCGSKPLVRNIRSAEFNKRREEETQEQKKMTKPNLVNELIEIKFEEIANEIETDWKNIFNDLDTWIQKAEAEEVSFEKLQPLQDEVNTMTNEERAALDTLKNFVPKLSILKIIELVKKLQSLLQRILDMLNKLPK